MNNQVAQNFGAAFAMGCEEAGIAGWVMDRLADTSLSTAAIRARHNLPVGTRDFQAFFPTFAKSFPRLAQLAVQS